MAQHPSVVQTTTTRTDASQTRTEATQRIPHYMMDTKSSRALARQPVVGPKHPTPLVGRWHAIQCRGEGRFGEIGSYHRCPCLQRGRRRSLKSSRTRRLVYLAFVEYVQTMCDILLFVNNRGSNQFTFFQCQR